MRSHPTYVVVVALLLGVACGASGCFSSTYVPRPSPRISTVMRNGSIAFMRDGQEFGLFGGNRALVAGSSAAEAAMQAFRNRITGGTVLYFLGFGMGVAGFNVLERGGRSAATAADFAPRASEDAWPRPRPICSTTSCRKFRSGNGC